MNTRETKTHKRTIVGLVVVLVVVAGMGAGAVMAVTGPGDDGTVPTAAQTDQADENETANETTNETTEPTNETEEPVVVPTGPDLTRTGDYVVYTTPAGDAYGVDNLSVEATDEDGVVLVTATVTNTNDWLAVQNVELRIDGAVMERMPVALYANDSQTVSFTVDTSEWETGDHYVAVLSHDNGAVTTVSAEEPVEEPQNASIVFEDQTSDGETVTIDEVTLSDGGFVVLHESTSLAEGDALGSTVGVSEYLEAGTHENVTVTMFDDVELDGETNMTAMAHLDTNENEEFDFVTSEGADDGPYVVDGEAVVDDAVVTVEPVEEPQNASVTFENQTSDGESVTIDEVTLSNGGFVVLHESTSLAEGDALGSTVGVSEYLEAGTHENVTVTMFDDVELDGEIEMTAMAHLDTNENEEFDFVTSEGADDGPYVVDGEAVVDDAVVTVEMAPPTTERPTNETTTEEPTETTTEEPTETTTEEPTETTTEEPTETTTEEPTETTTEEPTETTTEEPTETTTEESSTTDDTTTDETENESGT